MIQIQPEHAIAGTGALGLAVWTWSKLRRIMAQDGGDASAYNTMRKTLENLRDENTRLHTEVMRLQTEITRLQGVVTSLLGQLSEVNGMLKQNSYVDQMAREGKIDRRNRGEGPYDSRTRPEALPEITLPFPVEHSFNK